MSTYTKKQIEDARHRLEVARHAWLMDPKNGGMMNDERIILEVIADALAERQPVELTCVAEILADAEGIWMTCSGCHESNEGVPTGPYSQVLKCHLGNGCGECGGIGAVWDTTNYQEMSESMALST